MFLIYIFRRCVNVKAILRLCSFIFYDTALLPIDAEPSGNATLNEVISAKVRKVYIKENGNISRNAQRLAIDRNTVKR